MSGVTVATTIGLAGPAAPASRPTVLASSSRGTSPSMITLTPPPSSGLPSSTIVWCSGGSDADSSTMSSASRALSSLRMCTSPDWVVIAGEVRRRRPYRGGGTFPRGTVGAMTDARPSRLHHYAFLTKDQEATRAFYEDMIGLPLVATWSEADEIFGAAPRVLPHVLRPR